MPAVLEIQGLCKTYPKPERLALDGVSLIVDTGSIYAFVGPNGAGKTTAIRIIATLLAYDSGIVRVGGYDVATHKRDIRQRIGYIPDVFGFYDEMLVWVFVILLQVLWYRQQPANSANFRFTGISWSGGAAE